MVQKAAVFDARILRRAALDAFRKLDPRHQVRNPVMFVVEIGSILTSALWLQALGGGGEAPANPTADDRGQEAPPVNRAD